MPSAPQFSGVVLLLCGLPFSGKSTLARALAEACGAHLVVLDDIVREAGIDPGDGAPAEVWANAHQRALSHVMDAIAAGHPLVVVDDTNCFRFLRDGFRTAAAYGGYDTRLVVLHTPREEIDRRRVESQRNVDRPTIRDEVFAQVADAFEWPARDEAPIEWPWDRVFTASETRALLRLM